LGALADMTAALYALESAWLRCRKIDNPLALAATRTYGADACAQVEQWGRCVLAGFSAGDTLRAHAGTLRRLLKPPLLDTISLRRQLAAAVLDHEGYPW